MTEAGFLLLLSLAVCLFAVDLFGLLSRRGVLFQLLSLEVMLSGPVLAFVAAGTWHGDATGQGMFTLTLALAAAKVGGGLALNLRLRRVADIGDRDSIDRLRR